MGKVKQRNWLIIITIFLVIVSSVGLLLSVQQKLSFNSCAYGDEIYRSGEDVPGYNGKGSCLCNSDGTIKCDEDGNSLAYSSFSSANLKFSYKYLNLLNTSSVSEENLQPGKASYTNGKINISLERDVLCGEDGAAPTQSGFYQLSENELRLTIMTNKDSSLYALPCKIEDSFEISNQDLVLKDNFQVYYQSEDGSLSNLGTCVYDGKLYGDQEAFKSTASQSVCLCDFGVVACK